MAVWTFCRDYAKSPRYGRRMVIWGPNGTGKTHSALAIHNWAGRCAMRLPLTRVQDGEHDTMLATSQFLYWPRVVDGFKRGEWDVIEQAADQSLLVLDDLGAEHDPSGIAREKLAFILERRAHRWMVMTTNINPDFWEEKFERRISSRLLRNSEIVGLDQVHDYAESK